MQPAPGPETTAKRQEFYRRLGPRNLSPLWEVLKGIAAPEPKSKAVPFQWRYDEIRPLLLESGSLLTADEAERRVLVLENPSFAGQSRITTTLFAGVQLIMPGETAPVHRHTPSALRFMLEGAGAYTAVDGERTSMHAGDFIITPAWAWHAHGNEGSEPCVWMDAIDLPMVAFFETMFFEEHNDRDQIEARPEGDAHARFGEGLLPLDAKGRENRTSPVLNYPYARTRDALLKAARGRAADPHFATTLRYANPLDGGWTTPTLSTWMTYVPKGFKSMPIRSTESMVMAVAEGGGALTVGEKTFDFGPGDIHSVPGWSWRSVNASDDTFLFFFSDRAAQEKLGFFREQRR